MTWKMMVGLIAAGAAATLGVEVIAWLVTR